MANSEPDEVQYYSIDKMANSEPDDIPEKVYYKIRHIQCSSVKTGKVFVWEMVRDSRFKRRQCEKTPWRTGWFNCSMDIKWKDKLG
jgi:hypothetical protein